MSPWARSLVVVAIVSALPLLAMMLLVRQRLVFGRYLAQLVPLAVGALLGAPVFHLVPEALAHGGGPGSVAMWVAVGAMAFFLVDRLLHVASGTVSLRAGAPEIATSMGVRDGERLRSIVPLLVAGDALHNAVDGALIAAAYLDDPTLGIVTGLAVALHEMPRELGTFAVLVGAGVPISRALGINVATAVLAAATAILTLVAGQDVVMASSTLLAIGAGNFLYLGGALAMSEVRAAASMRGVLGKLVLVILGVLVTSVGRHGH